MIKPQYRTDEPSVRLTTMHKAMVRSPSEGVEVSIKAGAETDKIGRLVHQQRILGPVPASLNELFAQHTILYPSNYMEYRSVG